MNVEHVAGYFMVQHYVETISEPDRVLTVSPNTVLWLDDEHYVLLQITWELKLTRINAQSCMLTCTVGSATENAAFAEATQERIKDIDQDDRPFQMHIREETPQFAKDIERKALARVWDTITVN